MPLDGAFGVRGGMTAHLRGRGAAAGRQAQGCGRVGAGTFFMKCGGPGARAAQP